jgi:hypothetical protein
MVKTIPAAERGSPSGRTAAEMLTAVAEHGGPVEFASETGLFLTPPR